MTRLEAVALTIAYIAMAAGLLFLLLAPHLDDGERDLVGVLVPATAAPPVEYTP